VAAIGLLQAGTNGVVYTRQMFGQARGEVMVFARPAFGAARGRRTHPAADPTGRCRCRDRAHRAPAERM